MEPRPDKEDPDSSPSDRDSGDFAPKERNVGAGGEMEDGEELVPDEEENPGEVPEDEDYDPLDEDLEDDPEEVSEESPPAPGTAPGGPDAPRGLFVEESPPAPEAAPGGVGPRFSRKDLIWLGVLGVAVLVVMIYAVGLFFGDVNTSTPDKVDFPVKGESVVIRKIDTYWRKPDREVDLGVRLKAKFIPAAEVKLKSSGSGSLRFFFENPEGERIGDSVTLAFSGGSFDKSGEESAHFNATSGFEDVGAYNDYLTEKVHFWYLVVLEGPGLHAEGSEYKKLLRIRISSKRR